MTFSLFVRHGRSHVIRGLTPSFRVEDLACEAKERMRVGDATLQHSGRVLW